jgi:hypothetical protein
MVSTTFSRVSLSTLVMYILLVVILPLVSIVSITTVACSRDEASNHCVTLQSISNGCIPKLNITAKAEYKFINSNSCSQFKTYLTDLQNTASKYSTPTLKLNEYIIAGIIDRETRWGSVASYSGSGCDIRGDYGRGFGIAQMDWGAFPELRANPRQDTKVKLPTKKHGNEEFNWSSCKESIQFVGAYLLNRDESNKNTLKIQLTNAGLDATEGDNGFKNLITQKAYLQLLLNSYNAGIGNIAQCKVNSSGFVSDACTTGQNYGSDVLNRAQEFYICLNNRKATDIELLQSYNRPDPLMKLEECWQEMNSPFNSNIDIPSNFIYSKDLKNYTIKTNQLLPSPIPSEFVLYGESISLIKDYQKSIGANYEAWGAQGPAQKWPRFMLGDKTGFRDNDKYTTSAITNYDLLEPGDIIFMGEVASNPAGHTGIFVSKTNDKFTMFDQWVAAKRTPDARLYSKSRFIGAIRYIKK